MNDRKVLVFGFQTADIESAMLATAVSRPIATTLGGAVYVAITATDDAGNATELTLANAVTLATFNSENALLTNKPGNWSIAHTPAAATRATITRAAGGAGVRHVCTSLDGFMGIIALGAPLAVQLNLRDGATGAGPILWSRTLFVDGTLSGQASASLAGLNIVGSVNTAMTLEMTAATPVGGFESVALSGYSTL